MSGTEGKKETPISSPKDKKTEDYKPYRFKWVKKVINLIYRQTEPN